MPPTIPRRPVPFQQWAHGRMTGHGWRRRRRASSGSVFGWYNGDFNLDGKINIDDYGIIDGSVNAQGSPILTGDDVMAELSAVPEPAMMALLGLIPLLARRRRRLP